LLLLPLVEANREQVVSAEAEGLAEDARTIASNESAAAAARVPGEARFVGRATCRSA
jgi:hypothetical protein